MVNSISEDRPNVNGHNLVVVWFLVIVYVSADSVFNGLSNDMLIVV